MERLLRDLESASFQFYTAIDNGSDSSGEWTSIYRLDFARYDRTIKAARKALGLKELGV